MARFKYFPYRPRERQAELIEFIAANLRRGANICIHAPTGFGKTPVVLAALLEEIEGSDLRIIWAVRTGNETDRPVEELMTVWRSWGEGPFGMSLRGKRDMCLLAREKGIRDYRTVENLCRLKKDTCPYYRRVRPFPGLTERPLTFSELMSMASERGMCPYYLQFLALRDAKLVALSYNYILGPAGWAVRRVVPFGKSILVVDEAHNVEGAAMSVNSEKITTTTVERAIEEVREYFPEETDLIESLESVLAEMRRVGRGIEEDGVFYPLDLLAAGGLEEVDIETLTRLGGRVQRLRASEGRAPRSSLHRLGEFLDKCLRLSGEEGVAFIVSRARGGRLEFEVWDMRAREFLSGIWPRFYARIFMSGTLAPIDAFSEAVGLGSCQSASVPSEVDPERVESLITRDLTTRGESLPPEMARAYVDSISDFLEGIPANVAVFTASYRIQSEIAEGVSETCQRLGRPLFVEREGMSGDEARKMLEDFKASAHGGTPAVLMGPMGGRFSEGADFPGRELVGVYLVGIPFDRMTVRTRLLLEFREREHGRERGRYLAYVVPAMRRASQALGRVIRSREDPGMFVLGDSRYARHEYFSLLPDFIRETAVVVYHDDLPHYLGRWASRNLRSLS